MTESYFELEQVLPLLASTKFAQANLSERMGEFFAVVAGAFLSPRAGKIDDMLKPGK